MEQQFKSGTTLATPPTVVTSAAPVNNAAPRRSAMQDAANRQTASRMLLLHLERLLTLKNASESKDNLVIAYCVKVLEDLGRQANVDKRGNIWCPADAPFRGNLLRGIVAHTDSVMQNAGHKVEPIIFERGVFRSKFCKRPIGGDDKVGVAIALTIAELFPEFSVTLPADEEVGLKGAFEMVIPKHNLLVECDRKGSVDLVHSINNQPILSQEAVDWVADWLPHRNPTTGGRTDVLAFVNRDMAENATNLSCGYYKPHDKGEIVVFAHVYQTYLDAITLLCDLPLNVKAAKKDAVKSGGGTTYYANGGSYSGNNYNQWQRGGTSGGTSGGSSSNATNAPTQTAGHIEASDVQAKLDAMMPCLFKKEEGAKWELTKSGTLRECGFANQYERKNLPETPDKWTWYYSRDVRTIGTYLRNEQTGQWYIYASYVLGWVKWEGEPMVYKAGGLEVAPPPSANTPAPSPNGDGAGQGQGVQIISGVRAALPLTDTQKTVLPGLDRDVFTLHILRDGTAVNFYAQNQNTNTRYKWNGSNNWQFLSAEEYQKEISVKPAKRVDPGAAIAEAEQREGVSVVRCGVSLDTLNLASYLGLPEELVKPNLDGSANSFDYVVRHTYKWLFHVKSRRWFRFNTQIQKWALWAWGPFSEAYEQYINKYNPAAQPLQQQQAETTATAGATEGGVEPICPPFAQVASPTSSTEAGGDSDVSEDNGEEGQTLPPGVTMQDTGKLIDFGLSGNLRVGLQDERTDHWTYIEREEGRITLLVNIDSQRWYVYHATKREWLPVMVGPSSEDGQPTAIDISAALISRPSQTCLLMPPPLPIEEGTANSDALFTDAQGRDVTASTLGARDYETAEDWD